MKFVRRRGSLAALLVLSGLTLLWQGAWIEAKAWLAYGLIDAAWAREQAGEQQARPWPWADTWPVARLRVPRLGVERTVLAGASGRTLAFGPGHVDGTVPPGSVGNTVISAHRDTHFRFLRDLRFGDTLELEAADGRVMRYRVVDLSVRNQSEVDVLAPSVDSRLTLITCYPFDTLLPGTPHRYVVSALATGDAV